MSAVPPASPPVTPSPAPSGPNLPSVSTVLKYVGYAVVGIALLAVVAGVSHRSLSNAPASIASSAPDNRFHPFVATDPHSGQASMMDHCVPYSVQYRFHKKMLHKRKEDSFIFLTVCGTNGITDDQIVELLHHLK